MGELLIRYEKTIFIRLRKDGPGMELTGVAYHLKTASGCLKNPTASVSFLITVT